MRRICIFLALVLLAPSCKAGTPKRYTVEVVKEYRHDTGAYTQGLFFHDGKLYESTGQYGESTIRIVDLETGEVTKKLNFARKYFAEGSVILGDNLYVLTWTNKVAFIYDAATLEYKQTYSYPREGWGLTTDGKNLIASDGSSRLFFLTPEGKRGRVGARKGHGKIHCQKHGKNAGENGGAFSGGGGERGPADGENDAGAAVDGGTGRWDWVCDA